MANDDLKEIKELLEIVGNKVGRLETHVSTHSATMHLIKDQQSVMNEKLDDLKEDAEETRQDSQELKEDVAEVKETLESHDGALVRIESRLEGFADAWKINRAEINKVKRHLGLPSISE